MCIKKEKSGRIYLFKKTISSLSKSIITETGLQDGSSSPPQAWGEQAHVLFFFCIFRVSLDIK